MAFTDTMPSDFAANDIEEDRVVPSNIEAEQALLGALLISNEVYYRVSPFLKSEHFYDPLHAQVYDAIELLITSGRVADPVTLKPRFEDDPLMAEIGGATYLATLASGAVSIVNAVDYARQVFDLALRRGLIDVGKEMVSVALNPAADAPPSEQIQDAEQRLFSLAEQGTTQAGFVTLGSALVQSVDMTAKAFERDSHLSGISTGIRDLDQKLGGLQASDLLILAGRPAMGKTSLAMNIAFNIAKAYRVDTDEHGNEEVADGAAVAFYSLEMSSEQLATRLLAEESGVPSFKMRRGQISEDEYREIADTAQTLERVPLFIDDTGGLSIAALTARARRLKRTEHIGCVVVDYIQLVTPSGRAGSGNRVQEISEVTQGLKALAKELSVPIIALSQLSRTVESREDKRPQLSDLRESGSIEQDADVVMFVYREEYYLEQQKPPEDQLEKMEQWQEKMNRFHGKAEVIIGKQRHGPTGKVDLAFQAEITKFSDLAQDDSYNPDNFGG